MDRNEIEVLQESWDRFDKCKGTYALLWQVDTAVTLTIGALGSFEAASGFSAHVGSAFGRGLRGD